MVEFVGTDLSGVYEVTPRRFEDDRGFFSESFSARAFSKRGFNVTFVQDNHSLSTEVGTVRGLHFQRAPHAQAKLVRCGRGRIFDVAVDIRKGSPTFGRWHGAELSFENGRQLFVPAGFAHGFMTLEPNSEIIYKCSDFYAPKCDGVIFWNDPEIGIEWPLESSDAILSEKDATALTLNDFDSPFVYEETSA